MATNIVDNTTIWTRFYDVGEAIDQLYRPDDVSANQNHDNFIVDSATRPHDNLLTYYIAQGDENENEMKDRSTGGTANRLQQTGCKQQQTISLLLLLLLAEKKKARSLPSESHLLSRQLRG
jgi:hypothetical protein